MRTQRLRHIIRFLRQTISIHRKGCTIIAEQQRLNKILHHIAAKIRREIAHTDPLVRIRCMCIPGHIFEELVENAVRTKEFCRIDILRILCKEKGTIQCRIQRLLLIRSIIKCCRLRVPDTVGDGRPQLQKFLAHLRACCIEICLCEPHGMRQIPQTLDGIDVQITENIILRSAGNGCVCRLSRQLILLSVQCLEHKRLYRMNIKRCSSLTQCIVPYDM